ncbi:MAG: hypothetical protein ACR2OE_10070 [Thermomicrobiales bacterium]
MRKADLLGDTSSPDEDQIDEQEEASQPPPVGSDSIPEEAREIAQEVTRSLMLQSSWSGRLPRPRDLQEYDNIVPGTARDLVNDLLQGSVLASRSIDLDRDVSSRVLSIMEHRQRLDEEESQSDRQFRDHVFNTLRPIFYAPFIAIAVVLFAPIGDWPKVLIIVAIFAGSLAPLCISLLRGRMTSTESDVIKSVVPKVVAETRSALSNQDRRAELRASEIPRESEDEDGI